MPPLGDGEKLPEDETLILQASASNKVPRRKGALPRAARGRARESMRVMLRVGGRLADGRADGGLADRRERELGAAGGHVGGNHGTGRLIVRRHVDRRGE